MYSTPIASPVGPIQTQENIDAWAGILNMVYLMRDDQGTRLEATLGFGTGDGDRTSSSGTIGGNWTGSPDNAFNRLGSVHYTHLRSPVTVQVIVFRLMLEKKKKQNHP